MFVWCISVYIYVCVWWEVETDDQGPYSCWQVETPSKQPGRLGSQIQVRNDAPFHYDKHQSRETLDINRHLGTLRYRFDRLTRFRG